MWIDRVTSVLDKNKVSYAIVGGFAVALHGAVRGTVDLDLVLKLSIDNFKKAESALGEIGLKSKQPIHAEDVFHFRREYIKEKNLIAWNFYNPANPTELVDIIITHDLGKMKTVQIKNGGRSYAVLAVNNLIEMKKKSGRKQDLLDIQALRELRK